MLIKRTEDSLRFLMLANKHADLVPRDEDNVVLLADLAIEVEYLNSHPDIETTLLIHPQTLTDFTDYNQFLNQVDALLEALDLIGVFQVASFHPGYQFADTEPDD